MTTEDDDLRRVHVVLIAVDVLESVHGDKPLTRIKARPLFSFVGIFGTAELGCRRRIVPSPTWPGPGVQQHARNCEIEDFRTFEEITRAGTWPSAQIVSQTKIQIPMSEATYVLGRVFSLIISAAIAAISPMR